MRRPLRPLLLAATLASVACNRKDVDDLCLPGGLQFARGPSLVAESTGMIRDVRIAAVGSNFAIVWSEGPTSDDTDLYGRFVGNDGVPSSNEVRITQAAGVSSHVRLAAGPSGIGVSWSDGRFAQRVAMATVLPAGTLAPIDLPAVFQSPVVSSDQVPLPGIAVTTSGWVVAWNGRGDDGNDHLFAQVLTTGGAASIAPAFPLAAAQEDRATGPSVASVGTSGAVVVADDEHRVGTPDPDIWAYALPAPILVAGTGAIAARYGASSEAIYPEAVGFASGAGVVWTDFRDGPRTDLFYAPFGGGEVRLTAGPEEHDSVSVASAGAGFLMTWRADGELRFRAMKADGRPDGGPIAVGEASRGDVGWNGFSAAVVWIDPDSRIWFRPLACQ